VLRFFFDGAVFISSKLDRTHQNHLLESIIYDLPHLVGLSFENYAWNGGLGYLPSRYPLPHYNHYHVSFQTLAHSVHFCTYEKSQPFVFMQFALLKKKPGWRYPRRTPDRQIRSASSSSAPQKNVNPKSKTAPYGSGGLLAKGLRPSR